MGGEERGNRKDELEEIQWLHWYTITHFNLPITYNETDLFPQLISLLVVTRQV